MCNNSSELTSISSLLTELLEKYTDTATKVERMYTFLKQGRSVVKGEVTQVDVHVQPCKDGDIASDPSEDETKFVSVSIIIMSIIMYMLCVCRYYMILTWTWYVYIHVGQRCTLTGYPCTRSSEVCPRPYGCDFYG